MQGVAWLLWNRDEQRLRAGWRVAIHGILWLFTPVLFRLTIGAQAILIIHTLVPDLAPIGDRFTIFGLTLLAVLISTWGVVHFIDRRTMAGIGFSMDRMWWGDMLFGLGLGAFLITLIFGLQYLLGWVDVQGLFLVRDPSGPPFFYSLLGPVVAFLVIGITEEILSSGYQVRNLAEGLNGSSITPERAILWAWIISSILFGLLHVFNPYASVMSTLQLTVAGAFFGLGYILTGRLGLPIGVHIAWNFFQGNVYGFPVSGNDFTNATVIAIRQQGPELWTGGAFGPEAGLLGLGAMLLGALLTLVWVRYRYHVIRLQRSLACYEPPAL
jgi:uncharacterized protein